MTPLANRALDAGSLMTKQAVGRRSGEPQITVRPTAPTGHRDFLAEVLADAPSQERGAEAGGICMVVPDSWLDGDIAGAQAHEAMRHTVEDDLGQRQVTWVGQLSAIAALAAARPEAAQGLCLVCDAGGSGVRAGLFDIADHTVRPLTGNEAPGSGWTDFDVAVCGALNGTGDPALGEWFATAQEQHRRAAVVLRQAAADAEFRDAPVYTFAGTAQTRQLTAGQLLDCFEPTAERLRSAIAAVLRETTPVTVLLAGGFAWFPPVADVVADTAGAVPEILDLTAAVRGALVLGRGDAHLAPVSLPPMSLPAHEIRGGLLVETRLPLSLTSSPADSGEVPLHLSAPDLTVDIAGQLRTIHLPQLVPGPYRIQVRAARAGRALLILRPDYGGSQTALISPLDLEP